MFSKTLEVALNKGFVQAKEKHHEFMTVEHLLLAMLDNPEAVEVLMACGVDVEKLSTSLSVFIDETTPRLPEDNLRETQPTLGFQRVLQRAIFQVQAAGETEVTGIHVLLAIFNEQESQAVYFLNQENISRLDIVNYITHKVAKQEDKLSQQDPLMDMDNESILEAPSQTEEGGENLIERYTVNLNEKAKRGEIDPLIGREHEITRAIQVLCRRHKNNPIFVGEAGVGKTAMAEGLARRIHEGEVPEQLAKHTIYSLDMGVLLAGTKYRGDFEKRFKSVLKQLEQIPGAIIFIDEIHTLIGAGAATGGAVDASNLIKPLLTSGRIRCMGATTYQEYRNVFSKDHALNRRFQKIDIKEPTVEEAIDILKGLKKRFEEYHKVRYTDKALEAAVRLSERYINDRSLPDSAIDVIDEVGAYQWICPVAERKKVIHQTDIEAMVAKIARIPSARVSVSDREMLRNLENDLKMLVFGQNEAIDSLCAAIKLSRSGLRENTKPIGSFLFAGPTGVGKTEVTAQLAKLLNVNLIRFDMSEYMEAHAVARLIGAPPGYVGYEQGGLLTEAVNKTPHAVLLLDEIEKAHPDIFNLLLQVMDHGTLTDNNGVTADFRHVIIVMTSNAGAEALEKGSIGFAKQDRDAKDSLEEIKRLFSPEFRNRLDAVILFKHLTEDILTCVTDKFISELEVQLEARNVSIVIPKKVRKWLSEHGYDRTMGARPMARLIENEIKKPLASELLFGKLAKGGKARVITSGEHLAIEII